LAVDEGALGREFPVVANDFAKQDGCEDGWKIVEEREVIDSELACLGG